jgi:hypothetical protein
MNDLLDLAVDRLAVRGRSPGLSLIEIMGSEREAVTELIARLTLTGTFRIIPASEWLPDQDSLRRAVRRHTVAVHESLEHIRLTRPSTCLQVLDLLSDGDAGRDLLLVLDFLHHFHNADVDLDLRYRVLEECCGHLKRLALIRPVVLFVRYIPQEEYEDFLPFVIEIADEVIRMEEVSSKTASQPGLFEGADG